MLSDPAPRHPLPYYVEREPTIAEIVAWALQDTLRRRLLSLVGPPGSGKSTTLHQLQFAPQHLEKLIVLPVLNLKTVGDGGALWTWLDKDCNQGLALNFTLKSPGDFNAPAIAQAIGSITSELCHNYGAIPVLVCVDGLDEADEGLTRWRTSIQEFLVPVLRLKNVRIVMTRRDDFALSEAMLRWQEDMISLKPLPTPEEQMRMRLENSGQGSAWPWRELWEDALDLWIATLSEAQRQQYLDTLRPALTPSPIINVLLLDTLRQAAMRPELGGQPDHGIPGVAQLGPNEFRACLRAYLERAGLDPGQYAKPLIDLGEDDAFCKSGLWVRRDYNKSLDGWINPLLEAGVVESNKGYRFEPGVVALICLILGKTAP